MRHTVRSRRRTSKHKCLPTAALVRADAEEYRRTVREIDEDRNLCQTYITRIATAIITTIRYPVTMTLIPMIFTKTHKPKQMTRTSVLDK